MSKIAIMKRLLNDLKLINNLIFFFSLAGLFVSSYLAYEYSLPSSITCPIGGSGCQTVRVSGFSEIMGISVPFFGILFYFVLSLFSVFMITKEKDLGLQRIRFLGILSGFVFSLYLTYLESFVINAYCFWCLTSAGIVSAMFLLSLLTVFKTKTKYYE